jgi:hypothetical protein
MSKSMRLIVSALALASLAAPALAQQAPNQAPNSDVIVPNPQPVIAPPVDTVDRIPGAQGPNTPRPTYGLTRADGVRIVKPGALLLASYDSNHDGKITRTELEAGAAASFLAADTNGDGMIAGFEQNAWSAAVGSSGDVLSNPLTFDSDLDRQVSKAEFLAGIRKIAGAIADPATGEIQFATLVQPLNQQQQQQASAAPQGGAPGNRAPAAPLSTH